jgi:predicted ester cyclase
VAVSLRLVPGRRGWNPARMSGEREALVDRYRQYNAVCNRHAFDELPPYLCDVVLVNGSRRTAQEYIDDLVPVHRAFPDYHWEMQRVVVEKPWLAVQLSDRGTHLGTWQGVPATGAPVRTDEFAMYRFEDDRIAEVWVTADNARLPIDPGQRPTSS